MLTTGASGGQAGQTTGSRGEPDIRKLLEGFFERQNLDGVAGAERGHSRGDDGVETFVVRDGEIVHCTPRPT